MDSSFLRLSRRELPRFTLGMTDVPSFGAGQERPVPSRFEAATPARAARPLPICGAWGAAPPRTPGGASRPPWERLRQQHPLHLLLVRVGHEHGLAERALAARGLLGEDVALHRLVPGDLAGASDLEALCCCALRLQFQLALGFGFSHCLTRFCAAPLLQPRREPSSPS